MAKDDDIVGLWQGRLEQSKDERTRWEAQVATTMSFAEGNHRRWWDDEGNEQVKEMNDHEVWRTVNLMNRALSIIVTRVTANNPRWSPKRSGLENVSRDEIDAATALLQDVWDGEELGDFAMKDEMKLVIRNAFLQGGGLVYVRFDDELDIPVVEQFEMWDTYSDPTAQRLREKRWLMLALPKGVDELKATEKYDQGKVKKIMADAKLAESGIKQAHVRRMTGGREQGIDTIITLFTFEIDGKNLIHRVIAGDQVLSEETMKHPENKQMHLSTVFDIYHPVQRGRFYERPEVSDWIDPQKTIDKIYTNIENYIDCFLQGRWLRSDENTEIPRAGTQGQIIDGSSNEIQAMDMQPLPGTHFEHLRQAILQFEQISGVHSESMGRQSGSAESGVALAQLQALDEQNTSDAVDNFKLFLARVGLKVLFQASSNWNKTKTLYKFDKTTGDEKAINVIGDKAGKARATSLRDGTVRIRPFKRLDIDIVIGQFFEEAQKRAEIQAILQSGWTPGQNPVIDRVILDAYDIGVGREIVDELRALENPDMMIAKGKAAKIAQGESVEVNFDDPHQFLQDFYAGEAEKALEEGDQAGARALNAQAQKHSAHIQQGVGGVGSPEVPNL